MDNTPKMMVLSLPRSVRLDIFEVLNKAFVVPHPDDYRAWLLKQLACARQRKK